MAGEQDPRLIETPGGMINAMGLQNIGVKAFIEKKLPLLRPHTGTACIANVFGYEIRDYVGVIEALNSAPGIAAYELNASCPNTQHGGMVFGTDTGILDQLVTRAKAVARRPLIVKLSPNVTSIAQMAKCAENAGADALSLVNTFLSLSIDVESRRPRIANNTGEHFRPRDQAHCRAHGLRKPLAQSSHSGLRPGRHRHRGRRRRISPGGSNCRPDWHCQLCRPARGAAYRRIAGALVCSPPHLPRQRPNRRRASKRIIPPPP